MTTFSKSLLAFATVGALAGLVAFFGLSPFGKQIIHQTFGSPTGTTFGTAKVAEVTMAPIAISATSSSILNSEASDRIVDSAFVSCATSTGSVYDSNPQTTGVASWNLKVATTSVANQGLQGNTNYAANITIGTSTTDSEYSASSTNPALIGNRTWKAGTYMTFLFNATSSTALLQCQPGVYYHGS